MKNNNLLKSLIISTFFMMALNSVSQVTNSVAPPIDYKKAEQEAIKKGMNPQEVQDFLMTLANQYSDYQAVDKNDPKAYLRYIFPADSMLGFDEISLSQQALQRGFFGFEFKVFMYSAKRNFINRKYGYSSNPSMDGTGVNARPPSGNGINAAPCVNEGFEASPATTCTTTTSGCAVGSGLAGWTISQGQNNGSCTMAGCCPTAGSTNAWIRQTPWTDMGPIGVIPNSPLGGSKVIQMNDQIINSGEIVRIQQTFPVTTSNALFQFAYMAAMDGTGHPCCDQPFLKISLYDCSNNPLACSSVSITPPGASCSVSIAGGWVTNPSGISYTPVWQLRAIDLSPYLGSCVTIQVTVGDCDGWGHYGYAYFDAACSAGGGAAVSFCNGSGNAVLNAPGGYSAYQWIAPGGTIIPAPAGTQPTYTVTAPVAGQIYTVQVVTAAGCTLTLRDTIKVTNVNIQSISSSPSCLGGSSGTTSVQVTGSNLGYNYVWQNMATSATVGTTQSANGLSPGNYSVTVTTPSCGIASATVAVQISPPVFYAKAQNFCPGSPAIITASVGTGYAWYNNLTPIPSSAGSQSLVVPAPINGSVYYVTYTTPQGCKDSIKYTMTQITPPGSIAVSNVKSICPGSPPVSYGVVNLTTTQTGPFSYSVAGAGYTSTLVNTMAKKDSVVGLAIGVYTATVYDGACFYTQTFTVNPFVYTYTVTPTNTVLCVSGSVPMSANFGTTAPTACGLSTSGGCTNPSVATFGTGTTQNTNTGWPCIYGNWYKNNRHQLLYTAAELTAAGVQPGKISSIAFFINTLGTIGPSYPNFIGTLPGFTIKIKCTNVTSLNSTFDNVGLVTVVPPANYSPVNGWNTHNFATAYEWDGISNVLIDICYSLNTGSNYTSNPLMSSTNTGVIKCRYAYSDSQPMCGTTNLATTNALRPNARLGNCAGSNPANFTYSWSPSYALTSTNTQSTVATPSTSTIYTLTVNPINQINCAQSQTVDIFVAIPITPTITGGTFCTNFAPTQLTVAPTTGTWTTSSYLSPTGVFTPSLATVGANQVMYTTGAGTCVASNSLTVNVEQFIPATLTGTIVPLCTTNAPINLTSIVANPGGVWSGAGVSGTNFDPAVSGPGLFTLNYNTQSSPTASLCPDASSLQVNVFALAQPTISQVGPYCNTFAPAQLNVSPSGGVFSGNGTSAVSPSGLFDPANAVIGSNNVSYTVTNGPCVRTTSINVDVEQFISAALTSGIGPYCFNAPVVNLNNIVVNTGGTWTGAGVNSGNGTFDPLNSGSGDFVLTYATHSNPTASLCPDMATVPVHVNPQPNATVLPSTLTSCAPGNILFTSPTVNTGTGIWYFSDGASAYGLSTAHSFTEAGTYTVALQYTDDIGCTMLATYPGFITIYPVPVANFDVSPAYEVSIADPYVEFINQTTPITGNTWFWNIADFAHSDEVNTNWTFGLPGNHYVTLIATNEFGCADTIQKVISVKNEYGIWIPNTFTPNGDELNDEFRPVISPYGLDISSYEMDVFDRWGEKIFSTTDFMIGWNGGRMNKGEIMKNDVYVYKMKFTTIEKQVIFKTGHVTLMK